MALIKCPECGNEISTNAKSCPHCGTEITICPDCGNVYAGNPEICKNCGFAFKKTVRKIDDASYESIKEQWLTRADADNKITRFLKIFGKFLSVLDGIFFIVPAIIFAVWANSDPEDRVLSALTTFNNFKICVAICCVILILNAIYEFSSEKFIQIRFSNWLATNKIDLKDYLKVQGNGFVSDDSVQKNFDLLAYGEYFKENPTAKNYFYILMVITIILETVIGILIGFCVTDNIEIAMGFILWEQKVDLSELNYVIIASAGVAIILNFVVKLVCIYKQDKRFENWLTDETGDESADK